MDVKKIELLAMKNELMPDGLNQAEQLLFLSFRCLYYLYSKLVEQGKCDMCKKLMWIFDGKSRKPTFNKERKTK